MFGWACVVSICHVKCSANKVVYLLASNAISSISVLLFRIILYFNEVHVTHNIEFF